MAYTDSTGRALPLTIDLPAAKRVRDYTGVNLLTLDLPDLLQRLADPITLCEVLWCIAKPDADAAGLDLDGFLRRIKLDIQAITDQLLGELADFFLRSGLTSRATETTERWTRAKTATPSQLIESRSSGSDATNWPASSESIPISQA